jgi:NTP pyrophosphatase (non-canonical NTP hydrolase)
MRVNLKEIIMNLCDYQAWTDSMVVYPSYVEEKYLLLAFGGEVGELFNKYKKVLRGDDVDIEEVKRGMGKELGDCLFYLARLCTVAHLNLNYVMNTKLSFNHGDIGGLMITLGRHMGYLYESWDTVSLINTNAILKVSSVFNELCISLGYTVKQLAQENHDKLEDRKLRGVIKGSGDNR